MQLEPGAEYDGYRIEMPLGEGGMAVVYRVRHIDLQTVHALKVLMVPAYSIEERLLQEGRIQARLQHPNIVKVTDTIKVDGSPGIVMDYVDGPDLAQLLDAGPLSVPQIDDLAVGFLQGVAEAHSQGSIHRDLKPSNILLRLTDRQPEAMVCDFGLAKLLDPEKGRATSALRLGTPAYMAPEQIQDPSNVDERSDVWALGVILYELAARRRPFDGLTQKDVYKAVLNHEPSVPRAFNPDLPERMELAIMAALVKDKDARVRSVSKLLAIWNGEILPGNTAPFRIPETFDKTWDMGNLNRLVRSIRPEEQVAIPEHKGTWGDSQGGLLRDISAYASSASIDIAPNKRGLGAVVWVLAGIGLLVTLLAVAAVVVGAISIGMAIAAYLLAGGGAG